ncbi:serine/threonine-protein kinase [Nocardia wallacei]|uniref:serine/threonine-protein kinase n=1 Tax=Nocardia wallacei TaxID=480035 RepID=UPI00313EF90F
MDAPRSRAGDRFGPYELRSLLGRGGMGEVYEAYDTNRDRVVALKLLPRALAEDPAYQARFRRESQATAGLSEPHVIPIHTWGEINGVLYIDMRLVRGDNLRTLLRRHSPMDPDRAVALVEQVAAALDAAHSAGLVHRDVKPANILVTASDFAYLSDFGISRSEGDSSVTLVGTAAATYTYMAPERFDVGPVTGRADIYSLACVLHECLTGAPPYPSKNVSALIRAHLSDPPPRPSLQRSDVPPALDAVIAHAMAKVPDDRYATAGEFAGAARAAFGLSVGYGHTPVDTGSIPTPGYDGPDMFAEDTSHQAEDDYASDRYAASTGEFSTAAGAFDDSVRTPAESEAVQHFPPADPNPPRGRYVVGHGPGSDTENTSSRVGAQPPGNPQRPRPFSLDRAPAEPPASPRADAASPSHPAAASSPRNPAESPLDSAPGSRPYPPASPSHALGGAPSHTSAGGPSRTPAEAPSHTSGEAPSLTSAGGQSPTRAGASSRTPAETPPHPGEAPTRTPAGAPSRTTAGPSSRTPAETPPHPGETPSHTPAGGPSPTAAGAPSDVSAGSLADLAAGRRPGSEAGDPIGSAGDPRASQGVGNEPAAAAREPNLFQPFGPEGPTIPARFPPRGPVATPESEPPAAQPTTVMRTGTAGSATGLPQRRPGTPPGTEAAGTQRRSRPGEDAARRPATGFPTTGSLRIIPPADPDRDRDTSGDLPVIRPTDPTLVRPDEFQFTPLAGNSTHPAADNPSPGEYVEPPSAYPLHEPDNHSGYTATENDYTRRIDTHAGRDDAYPEPDTKPGPGDTYPRRDTYAGPDDTYHQPDTYAGPDDTYPQPDTYAGPDDTYHQPDIHAGPHDTYLRPESSGRGSEDHYARPDDFDTGSDDPYLRPAAYSDPEDDFPRTKAPNDPEETYARSKADYPGSDDTYPRTKADYPGTDDEYPRSHKPYAESDDAYAGAAERPELSDPYRRSAADRAGAEDAYGRTESDYRAPGGAYADTDDPYARTEADYARPGDNYPLPDDEYPGNYAQSAYTRSDANYRHPDDNYRHPQAYGDEYEEYDYAFGGRPDPDRAAPEHDDGYGGSRRRSIVLPIVLCVLAVAFAAVAAVVGWRFVSKPGSTAPSVASGPTDSNVPVSQPPPRTASSSGTSTATTTAAVPAGATECQGATRSQGKYTKSATGTSVTSCAFAEAVRAAYAEEAETGSGTPTSVVAVSPVTGRSYTMNCSPSGRIITCTGGENAVVYVY